MEKSGGQIAGKCAKSEDGEDRLSALPDDLLVGILVRLDTTAEAVRTSVLASRWRHLWRSLSEVRLAPAPGGHRIRVLLEAPEGPDLRSLSVTTKGAGPDCVISWLPPDARRLIGALVYRNVAPEEDDGHGDVADSAAGRIQLPCFERATKIELDLGLQKLTVCDTRDLDTLTIDSESLLQMELTFQNGLQHLTIVAPVLEELEMYGELGNSQLVADISTPQLVSLMWKATFDSQYANLGNLDQLQKLGISFIVFGKQRIREQNHHWLSLLLRFQVLEKLQIDLFFWKDLDGLQYLMGDITVLPQTEVLELNVLNRGHSFGASSFHLLRMCTGLRLLLLKSHRDRDLEAQSVCSSSCICDQPTSWKAEELVLNDLEYIAIDGLQGAEHEVTFVKQLFKWAVVLKKIKIRFDKWVSESKAREFLQALAGSSWPETCVELLVFHDGSKSWTCLHQKA